MAETLKNNKLFEDIKHYNEFDMEFWYARELQEVLEYTDWRNFIKVIDKAKEACKNSKNNVLDHFVEADKMVVIGSGAEREIKDIILSRYACYLIVQNGDPKKEAVALGQTYFAIQTRKQEYAVFQNYGYMGLYGGMKASDIHKAKGLKPSEKILDHMGSTELAANLFRATQTEEKLKREQIQGKENANKIHFEVGKKVRQTIEELGGTMPEYLPNPEKSIKQIEKEQNKKEIDN